MSLSLSFALLSDVCIPTGQGDCRKTVTFSSSSMSCKKSLRMKPEMFPDTGTFPLCGADWKSSHRTCRNPKHLTKHTPYT